MMQSSMASGAGPSLSPIQIALQKLKAIAVSPEDEQYKIAQKIYNPAYSGAHDQPAFVALPSCVDEVKRCLLVANETGVPVSVKCGGHSFAGYSNIGAQGFVIYLKKMKEISVEDGRVVVEAGALWSDVYEKLEGTGYLAVGGCCPTVGVAGYILGGGYGLQSRCHGGLGSDKALSFTMVTAKGDAVVTASDEENEDLFWALRGGGGGNFGVVVDITLKLSPSPKEFFWSPMKVSGAENIQRTLKFINTNLKKIPKELNLDMCLQPGGLSLDAVYSDQNKAAVLAFLDGIEKERYCSTYTSYLTFVSEYGKRHAYVSHENDPVYMKGAVLEELPEDVSEFLANLDIPSQPYMNVTLVHMGGDIGTFGPQATAFPHRSAQYSYYTYCRFTNDVERKKSFEFAQRVYDRVKTLAHANGSYVNYMDRYLEDWAGQYYGVNYQRLCEIKKKWNPTGTGCLHFQQEIGL